MEESIGQRYLQWLATLKKQREGALLIAVSKQQPLSKIRALYEVGCRDFGENKVQEALEKMEQAPSDIRWHFIGNLQENKVRKVVGRFYCIHSVASLKLLQKIAAVCGELKLCQKLLLQANTSNESSKGGLTPSQWLELLPQVAEVALGGFVDIEGWMTMGPRSQEEESTRQSFAALAQLRSQALPTLTQAHRLSMGMSGDWELALSQGADWLRLGSALFL